MTRDTHIEDDDLSCFLHNSVADIENEVARVGESTSSDGSFGSDTVQLITY